MKYFMIHVLAILAIYPIAPGCDEVRSDCACRGDGASSQGSSAGNDTDTDTDTDPPWSDDSDFGEAGTDTNTDIDTDADTDTGTDSDTDTNTDCVFGMDQTCNDSPIISSLHGVCNQDGTCTCHDGFAKNPATGKCL